MTFFAQRLCNRNGLSTAEVFKQQFILSRDRANTIPGFNNLELGAWHLSYGKSLPVCHASIMKNKVKVIFLGIGVDQQGDCITQANLSKKINRKKTIDSIALYLSECAGRYAFAILSDDCNRMYLDPCGSLGVVYNTETGVVASSVYLTITRRIIRNNDYPLVASAALGKGGRFAFGHTSDPMVKRPLANHYLEMDSLQQVRHWPPDDMVLDYPRDMDVIEAAIDTYIKRHQVILKALVKEYSPAILPLTGGADSRILMACLKDNLSDVDLLFTHVTNKISRIDLNIGEQIAQVMGQDFVAIDAVQDEKYQIRDPEVMDKLKAAYKISTGQYIRAKPSMTTLQEVVQATPEGGILMRGHVSDILKGVLWRRGVREYNRNTQHSMELGVTRMQLPNDVQNDPWFINEYTNWFDSLPKQAQKRPYDFMGLEQYRPNSLGSEFYAFPRNFYVAPGNDRKIIEVSAALPPDLRVNFYLNDMVLERTAPELISIPYTRSTDNDIRKKRKPLAKVL